MSLTTEKSPLSLNDKLKIRHDDIINKKKVLCDITLLSIMVAKFLDHNNREFLQQRQQTAKKE